MRDVRYVTEIVTAVLNMHARAVDAEEELAELRRDVANAPGPALSLNDRRMIEVGRHETIESCLNRWRKVRVSTDSNTLVATAQTFESWLDEAIDKVPDYMSMDEFREYFRDELFARYEEDKAEALEEVE